MVDVLGPPLQAHQPRGCDRIGLLHILRIATQAVGNPDSFWTIHLQRQPDGRWLIDNYGQG